MLLWGDFVFCFLFGGSGNVWVDEKFFVRGWCLVWLCVGRMRGFVQWLGGLGVGYGDVGMVSRGVGLGRRGFKYGGWVGQRVGEKVRIGGSLVQVEFVVVMYFWNLKFVFGSQDGVFMMIDVGVGR